MSSDGKLRHRPVHLRRERRKPSVLRLQDVHSLRDRRALARVRVGAPQPDDDHPLNAPVIGFVAAGPQSLVRRVDDCVPAVQTPHPLDQDEVRSAFQQDHRAPAGDNLEEDDAEAVDVGVGARVVRVDELWVDVPRGAHHGPGGVPPRAVVAEPGQAKVAEPGAEGLI